MSHHKPKGDMGTDRNEEEVGEPRQLDEKDDRSRQGGQDTPRHPQQPRPQQHQEEQPKR